MPANAVGKQIDVTLVIREDAIFVVLADKSGVGCMGGDHHGK
jgi:hypothetical protein